MEFDRIISYFSRRIPTFRGVTTLLGPIIRHYAQKYNDTDRQSILIHDFDGDLTLCVDRSSGMTKSLYWRGTQFDEIRAIRQFAQPESVFLDVGANIGMFSLVMSKHLNRGQVLAFEPASTNYNYLVNHIELNECKNIRAYQYGLSDKQQELQLYSNDPNNITSFNASVHASDLFATPIEVCHLRPLDEVFPSLGVTRVDIIKIDTEGEELHVLKGAQETIKRFKPVILLELNRQFYANAGYSAEELVQFLNGLQYNQMFIIKRFGRLKPVSIHDLPNTGDLIFIAQTTPLQKHL